MSAQILEQFAKAPAPGFRCYSARDKSGARFLASIHHALNDPASVEDIARAQQLLGDHAEKVAAFYRVHNGFVLYSDTKSDAAGIELFPIGQWAEATEDMRSSFDYLSGDAESDPDHILTGIAIATVPQSGNYFVMSVEGPNAGNIFYADHDGWYEAAFAEDFDGFLARVVQEPAKLLAEEVGCYTRYSDGATKTQWIPEEYFQDISKAGL